MGKETDILDPAVLEKQDNLTDEQEVAIRDKVIAEAEAEEKDGDDDDADEDDDASEDGDTDVDKGKKDNKGEDSEEDGSDDAEETDEQKAAKALEAVQAKPEEERTDEDKNILKDHDEAELQSEVSAFADETGIGEKAAKEEVEKIRVVEQKYGKDPRKMAKALLHLNRSFAKSQSEIKAIQEQPTDDEMVIKDGKGGTKKLNSEETKAFLVEKYREHKPKLTEGLEDDKVFEMAKNAVADQKKQLTSEKIAEIRSDAEKKRSELVGNLDERDKPFLGAVKENLSLVSDGEIVSDDFDVNDYIFHARGRKYHADVKAAEEKGYKRGVEQRKVLGKKESTDGGKPPSKTPKESGLSSAQKEEALSMYESLGDIKTDEEKFDMYKELNGIK